MALQLNTVDEGEHQFNFAQWVNDNNLTEIKDLLVKHKMTRIDTLNTTSAEYFKLMSDPALISKAHTIAILMKSMQKININVTNKPKVIRIYISKEEEDATDKLHKYNSKILDLQQKMKTSNDLLTKNIQKCNTNIELTFNDLLQKITAKKQEIQNELKSIEKEKRADMYAQLDKINKEQQNVENSLKECTALQDDVNMDRVKRKNKIITIAENVLKNVLSDDIANIDTQVTFDFDKNTVSSFINNLAQIYDNVKHPIPVISSVECKSITMTTASVHFNAALSEKDKDRKVSSLLFMQLEGGKDDMDEKEQTVVKCVALQFDKNKKKYEFKLDSLGNDTDYKMYINLYQSQNKIMRKMIKYKPVCVQFKTLDIDKRFVYQSDFDTNGICYGLGSNYGQIEWSNPATKGLIKLNSVTWSHGSIENVVGRSNPGNCYTASVEHAWISIDFGEKLQIQPSHYTLKHDKNPSNFLRTWNLEGSNDGNNWKALKKHENDTNLNQAYSTHTWTMDTDEYYQIFRIYMVGNDSSSAWNILCAGFEIYGHLLANK